MAARDYKADEPTVREVTGFYLGCVVLTVAFWAAVAWVGWKLLGPVLDPLLRAIFG